MNEDFLHYIWKTGSFDHKELRTVGGDAIEIVKAGDHNNDSGPDFFNAQIRIHNALVAGHVEIHINSSDWYKHRHEKDKAYDSVVLHVVLNCDAENHRVRTQVMNSKGDVIPELELKFRILPGVQKTYERLQKSTRSFPCAGMLKGVEKHIIDMWLERMLVERLEEKQEAVRLIYEGTNRDWQETFYRLLAKNFGFKTNADAFYNLARSVSWLQLQKQNSLFEVESLLFGQSGLLQDYYEDAYAKKLQNEYAHLQKKYKLLPLKKESWKFARMRPVSFPTIRIAQFAALLHGSSYLFSKIFENTTVEYIKELFKAEASEYWNTHYVFGKTSRDSKKMIGEAAMENILINTVAPLLFFYGRERKDEDLVNRAIDILAAVSAEDNRITREYVKAGYKPENAVQSQGLIQLNRYYCTRSACLKCGVGNYLLKG